MQKEYQSKTALSNLKTNGKNKPLQKSPNQKNIDQMNFDFIGGGFVLQPCNQDVNCMDCRQCVRGAL